MLEGAIAPVPNEKAVILTSKDGLFTTKTFKTLEQIKNTNGIEYDESTNTFKIDTKVFKGNIKLQYTIV